MIRHVVFFSVPIAADRQAVEDGLKLLEANPHALTLTVRANRKGDLWSNEVDFVVYGEFADEAALEAYRAHPTYAQSIEAVRAKRGLRIAADFVAE